MIIDVVIISLLIDVPCVLMQCANRSYVVEPGDQSFAEQIIKFARHFDNSSVSVFVRSGTYNATNGSSINFFNFINVTITTDPHDVNCDVNIVCPKTGDEVFNGIGFVNSLNITIMNINFTRCGPVTSALYMFNSSNILIADSAFHHNTDNGVQIIRSSNITIRNCLFYSNVGIQPDPPSNLISTNLNSTGGAGLGLFFTDQSGVKVSIENCIFKNNIAYKPADYVSSNDTRPFGYTPFGNGGGMYLQINGVQGLSVNIYNCNFYDNFAIHQGGGVVMISINSKNIALNISNCQFRENKALGNLLKSVDDTVEDIDNFINETKCKFSSLTTFARHLPVYYFAAAGGVGGAISVSLYGNSEFNRLYVKNSQFTHNSASTTGTISFTVRDSFSGLKNGVDSNRAFIYKYVTKY